MVHALFSLFPPVLTRPFQLLHQVPPPPVRGRTPRDRGHRLPSADQAPRHQRALHQRQHASGLREKLAREPDTAEGRASAGLDGREEQEVHQAGEEYQRECQRRLVTVSRQGGHGIEVAGAEEEKKSTGKTCILHAWCWSATFKRRTVPSRGICVNYIPGLRLHKHQEAQIQRVGKGAKWSDFRGFI